MKQKLYSKFKIISSFVTILIGIFLIFVQGNGGYIVVGVGLGYLLSSFFSEEKMAQVIENIVSKADVIFFRVLELLSIGFIILEGYATIGIVAFLSLISVEVIWKKKKS